MEGHAVYPADFGTVIRRALSGPITTGHSIRAG
jgi:hypothetical protein